MTLTSFPEIDEFLERYRILVLQTFTSNVVGIYLTGSLTYNDFNSKRSDIDLQVILKKTVDSIYFSQIADLHKNLEIEFPKWKNRIESSYTPLHLLNEVLPPKEPRPWYGFGKLYEQADYGNEWIINTYILQKFGIPLFGPDYNSLANRIDILEVKKACIKDFYKEWLPKTNIDSKSLDDPHIQSYVVLNICRILYLIITGEFGSKTISSTWIKTNIFPNWKQLITDAYNWEYGQNLNYKEEVIKFILESEEKLNDNIKL